MDIQELSVSGRAFTCLELPRLMLQAKIIGKGDPHLQTVQAIKNIETALKKLDSGLQDVVRTRMYVKNIDDGGKVAKGHAEFFGKIRPATAMVKVSRFIDSEILVEIEADVIVENAEH